MVINKNYLVLSIFLISFSFLGVVLAIGVAETTRLTSDIKINDKFNSIKDFEDISFKLDIQGRAVKSFDRETIESKENVLRNSFDSTEISVESKYEIVDTGFFNTDEQKVKQTYILKNDGTEAKNFELHVLYEIKTDAVTWDGEDYLISSKPQEFRAYEVTEERFPIGDKGRSFMKGAVISFGSNYFNFKDVLAEDYSISVYRLGGKNYIDLEIIGSVDALNEKVIDPIIGWNSHVIDSTMDGAFSAYGADVDSDGDIDVVSSSSLGDRIVWHENDGNENFILHNVTTSASDPRSIFAIDVDSDNDTDVLSPSFYDDTIYWHESNLADCTVPGVEIVDIIPIQVIENVDLVSGKSALVRAILNSSHSESQGLNVSLYYEGLLKGYNDTITIDPGQEMDIDLEFIPDSSGTDKEIRIEVCKNV